MSEKTLNLWEDFTVFRKKTLDKPSDKSYNIIEDWMKT